MDATNQQAPSGPTPTDQQSSISSSPASQKKTLLIISVVFILLALVGIGGYYLFEKNGSSKQNSNTTTQQVAPTLPSLNLQTVTLSTSGLNDPDTELYFADTNKIYKVRLDSSQPLELASLPRNVSSIDLLPNRDVLIYIEAGRYVENDDPPPLDSDYKQVLEEGEYEKHFWLLKNNSTTPENIAEERWNILSRFKNATRFERIYTKELPNGQADIMLDNLDGTESTKIGTLKQKLINLGCEFDPCPGKKYPDEFYPSFDGTYLLNKPPGGGGLGESAIVVSRDGSRIYNIDFYWFGSSAIWLDNNILLTNSTLAQDQKGAKVFTFNSNGTFTSIDIPTRIGYQVNQRVLSPNKKYIGVRIFDPNSGVGLFDVVTFEKRAVEIVKPENTDPNTIRVIGWNNDSSKMLYVLGDEAKIYDLNLKKVNVVASLKNGAPDWVKVNRLSFPQNIFEIR